MKRPGYHNTSGCAPPAAPVAGCAGADQEDAMLLSGSLLSHGFPPPYLGIRRPVKCLREKREFVGDSADAARERSSPTGKFFHRSCCGFRGRADRSSSARLAGMSTGRLASAGYNRATLPAAGALLCSFFSALFCPADSTAKSVTFTRPSSSTLRGARAKLPEPSGGVAGGTEYRQRATFFPCR